MTPLLSWHLYLITAKAATVNMPIIKARFTVHLGLRNIYAVVARLSCQCVCSVFVV